MLDYPDMYVNGAWRKPSGSGRMILVNPSSDEAFASIPLCDREDVDSAVAAAKAAFPSWSATSVADRVALLRASEKALTQRHAALSQAISQEMGAPIKLAEMVQVSMPIGVLGSYAGILEQFAMEETVGNSLVVREAVGVVGMITPWNYPLHQVIGKVAPALAAGCTMVLKPSEVAPLSAFILAEVFAEVGLPAGVFNLVPGTGAVVGEALAEHPEIDMISFTGSTRAGIRVAQLAAATVKRVAQELGGKSANLILADADFTKAITSGVRDCFFNSGQTCSALTRMLVPRDRLAEAETIAAAVAGKVKLGPASDPMTQMGPLSSKVQQERVREFIKNGIKEGAKLVIGGPEQPEAFEVGCFVKPTVFSNVSNQMRIAREEIFGPVLSIIPYDSEDDAVAIANDTAYGLSGSVWSGDLEHAKLVARRLRTGQVSINGGRWNPLAPFGGYKHSGNGRELGTHGLLEFLEVKSIQL